METLSVTPKVRALTGTKKYLFFFDSYVDNHEYNTASYWDSGSRSTYSRYNIKNYDSSSCPAGSYPDFKASITLNENEILIVTGTSCGKPAFAQIRCRKSDEAAVREFLGI